MNKNSTFRGHSKPVKFFCISSKKLLLVLFRVWLKHQVQCSHHLREGSINSINWKITSKDTPNGNNTQVNEIYQKCSSYNTIKNLNCFMFL